MHIERGSTWNRWDFHVHTPYSVLNNGFGFTPDPDWKSDCVEFDEYVRTLFTKAVENGIVAIGITDYFSIDGYKRIKEAYLSNPEKMAELFPNEELRDAIERIYVFPNIELRLDTFVGDDKHSVNYHVIFSGDIECSFIEVGFLKRLLIMHHTGTQLPISRASIKQIGKEYKRNNPKETRDDYLVGLEKVAIHHDKIIELLNTSTDLANKYFLSIPVDEDLSTLKWDGRYSETRRLLYHQCHFLMSSNEGTRRFALAEGHEEEQKREFGSIKPCIWGSDAHSYEKLFCPDKERYCWVKAEPTFSGLQQILYEPADRVRIQSIRPEEKDEHQIIDNIIFDNEDFSNEPIYFSEGLNCIIGGKSTGKSILLRHVAKSIDPTIVGRREEKIGLTQNLNVNAKVTWKDGESGERKIVYIPQSWLNRTVDDNSGSSEINNIIQEVLLQEEKISRAYRDLNDEKALVLASVKHDILSYVTAMNNAAEKEVLLKAEGRSKSFVKTISDLELKRKELSEAAGITQEDIIRYGELEQEEIALKQKIINLDKEQKAVYEMKQPFAYMEGYTNKDLESGWTYNFEQFHTVKDIFQSAFIKMNELFIPIWEKAKNDAEVQLKRAYDDAIKQSKANDTEITPLRKKIAFSEDLKKIEKQLTEEREKQKLAFLREKERDDFRLQAQDYRKKIIESRELLLKKYNIFSDTVSKVNQAETELEFGVQIDIKKFELFEAINSVFNTRNFRAFQDKYGINLSSREAFEVTDKLFSYLVAGLEENVMMCKGGFTIQTALEQIFSDWFYIHYIVKSEGDTIDTMSPGKKALVLLELIVNLEKGQCPILIDQPEDDLDNRSIYTDLVKYLKEKKHERQIIVVTHNANVVVGADAEEVIIANQAGKETENYSKRFEYRCGAIENIAPVRDDDGEIRKGVLNKTGIQEQICDILEGGKDAFEKRASKYLSTTQLSKL